MSVLRHLVLASALLIAPASAHHIDPYEVIDEAFQALKNSPESTQSRAVLSAAIRDAQHGGVLASDFGLVFAVYSDLVRFDGDASFALLLADQGLAVAATASAPDDDLRNMLLTSRAYALAELGRYREAVETVAITALWLGERFGDEARQDMEAEARSWAELDMSGGDTGLPSAMQAALNLLDKAEGALLNHDTATAINLASRAVLPERSGLDDNAVRSVNAWSRWIIGTAYSIEGRNRAALVALRAAVDLITTQPWDGRSDPAFREGFADNTSSRVVWGIFIRIAENALDTGDNELARTALDIAQRYSDAPDRRYSLLVQRAGLLMRGADLADVEAMLSESEKEAAAAGDEANAALARFYIAVVRMRGMDEESIARGDAQPMLDAARLAAATASANPRLAEYILATAVWQAVIHDVPKEAVLPVARQAFAVFRAQQNAMAGYDAGQDAARRDRRRFLESYIDALYPGK